MRYLRFVPLSLLALAAFVLLVACGDGGEPGATPAGPATGKIAFISDRDGNFEVYVMNADGTSLTNITDNPADDGSPVWSPDGSRIAFDTDRDGNSEIYVMNPDGTSLIRLTNDPANDLSPTWLPAP